MGRIKRHTSTEFCGWVRMAMEFSKHVFDGVTTVALNMRCKRHNDLAKAFLGCILAFNKNAIEADFRGFPRHFISVFISHPLYGRKSGHGRGKGDGAERSWNL
jgi:hypothetical protein